MLLGRAPAPPLSAFVELLWYAEDWKPSHTQERHMPDGSAGLIISLRESGRVNPADLAIFGGPHSKAFLIDTSEPNTIAGVQFKKGGASAFLDMPVSELHNAHVPLADLGGRSAASLRERLLEAATPVARLDLLEDWLTRRLHPERDPAVAWAVCQLERRPSLRVGDLTAHVGRSTRWFINRFSAEVGLTPKVFGRVQRFQLALRHAHRNANISLADLAASSGYFDQAHFSHDFRSIAGTTPTEYLAGRTEFLNHVAVRD